MTSRLLANLMVLPLLLCGTLSAQSLKQEYEDTKAAGLAKLYSNYQKELTTLRQAAATGGAVEDAIMIDDEIKVVEGILGQIEGAEPVTHIGKFDDSQAPRGGRLREVKNRYHDRIRSALTALDNQYIRRSEETMRTLLKQQKFEEARLLKGFHDELLSSRESGKEIDLLADSSHWVEVKGEWDFDGSKVLGEGDSELLWRGPELPESFTLTAEIRVKSGVRPRIYLGEYTLSNWDPKKFVLFPKQKTNLEENYFNWDHLRTHRVKMVYGPRLIELHIDGTLVEKHVEPTEPVKRFALSAGDYYSKGEVEFSNVRLRKGF